jgi:hypothetical protein
LTTDQQRRANRANAESSTGPKTAPGKSRSAKNAFRHELNLPVFSDPSLALEVEVIARRIAGPDTDDDLLEPARRIAEAQVDLERVRAYRRRMLTREIENPNYQPLRVRKLRRALLANQERFSHGLGPAFGFAGTEETASRKLFGEEQKLAAILEDRTREIATLDQYERRAFSRRKVAIRNFDVAKTLAVTKRHVI